MQHQDDMGIPVMVVEEQALFRGGLRTVLQGAGFRLLAEYSSPQAALQDEATVGQLEPSAVVLCSLSASGWQELVRRLLLQSPQCPILGVADELTEAMVIQAISHGIAASVTRTLTPDQWIDNVRGAHQGSLGPSQTLMRHPSVARHALVTLSHPPEPRGLIPLAPALGHRERLALASVSEGLPLESIRERLGVPEHSLHQALLSACRKLVARHRLCTTLDRVR